MMFLRKKLIFSSILVLILSVLLIGCSPSSKSSSGTGGGKVNLVWLVRTDPSMIGWEKEMIKTFEATHPNITVTLERIPQTEIDQRLSTMIAGKKMPDVWSANWSNSGFATYYHMGALMDLTPFFEKDQKFLSTIDPKIVKQFSVNGKNYGVPMLNLGSFVFYNKDLFDKAGVPYPPTNWDDQSWNYNKLLKDAKKLTKNAGKKNAVYGFNDGFSPDIQAWAFGGDFFKPKAYQTQFIGGNIQVDTPANKEALQYNADLINKYKVAPSAAALNAVSQIGDPFMTGKVAMTMTGGWGFWAYKNANFKWGVAPMPYHAGRTVPLYADPWNISKTSKHPQESWEFIKHLVDPKAGGKAFMEQTGATPADSSLLNLWYKQEAQQTGMTVAQIKQLNEGAIKYGKAAIGNVILKYSSILTTINQTATDMWNGKKTVNQGVKEMQSNLNSLNITQ